MSKRRHNFGTKRFKEKSLFIFHARIALKSLILLFVRLIARGARIGKTHTHTHRQTDRQTDRTSTVTLAHARRGLIMISHFYFFLISLSLCLCFSPDVLRFDNTYSWTRSKEVFYTSELLPPDTILSEDHQTTPIQEPLSNGPPSPDNDAFTFGDL